MNFSCNYWVCGITLSCNFALPEEVALSEENVDAVIEMVEVADASMPLSDNGALFSRLPGDLSVSGWITPDGKKAILNKLPADEAEALFLVRQVAPFLAGLQGLVVLHASAVVINGFVCPFIGESGTGKTTMARELERQGALLISDDLLPVLEHKGEFYASTTGNMRSTLDRLPLCGLFFLFRERRGITALELLSARNGMILLLKNGFSEVEDHHLWEMQFSTYGSMVRSLPSAKVLIPDDANRIAVTAREIELALSKLILETEK